MIVMTDLPIRKVLQKADVARRMVRWVVELFEGDFQWVLFVDGSSNQQGSGVGIILEGPNGLMIEQTLRFAFKASNNQVEYEALVAGMLLAKEMGARSLLVKSDSLVITGQVTGEYQAKDPQMAAYLQYAVLYTSPRNSMPELTCSQSSLTHAWGQTEESHPGNLKDAQKYHRPHGRGPAGKCLGRWKKRSPVVDPGNIDGT